jgi:hypothetical protein
MSIQAVLAPVFVQVLLTLAVAYLLGYRRFVAIRGGALKGPISLREPNWPAHALQAEYNYQNQFELPVLFYLLAVLAIVTRHADLFFVLMAWVFVVLRIGHAFVHLTFNRVEWRGPLFIAGAVVLTVMWVQFIVRIMLALP